MPNSDQGADLREGLREALFKYSFVIPAKAGIQRFFTVCRES